MKRYICILLLIGLLLNFNFVFAEQINLDAEAAILIDFDTGEILFEKNSHTRMFPASTTKMMTAILCVELGNLSDMVTIDQEVVSLTQGSHIALEPGETVSLKDLLYAMLLPSANDAAIAIAKHIGGSIENFVAMMNQKATDFGAKNTSFVNPSGLHDDRHMTSAYDLALIGRAFMQHEVLRDVVKTITYEIPITNVKKEARIFRNTNKFLFSTEKMDVNGNVMEIKNPKISGVKTGYTSKAKNCLVSYSEQGNQRLISVVLGANGNAVYADSFILLNHGFENFANQPIASFNQFVANIPLKDGKQPFVAGVLQESIVYPVSLEGGQDVETNVLPIEELTAPIEEGQLIGTVEYLVNGNIIGVGNIISTAKIELDPQTIWYNKLISHWYLFVIGGYIILRAYILFVRNKKRSRYRRRYR